MNPDKVTIFDTTLRDGEQSPGCSMNLREKLSLARQLEIKAGQLVALQVGEMRLERKLYLIHRSGARLSHAARAFLSIARQT